MSASDPLQTLVSLSSGLRALGFKPAKHAIHRKTIDHHCRKNVCERGSWRKLEGDKPDHCEVDQSEDRQRDPEPCFASSIPHPRNEDVEEEYRSPRFDSLGAGSKIADYSVDGYDSQDGEPVAFSIVLVRTRPIINAIAAHGSNANSANVRFPPEAGVRGEIILSYRHAPRALAPNEIARTHGTAPRHRSPCARVEGPTSPTSTAPSRPHALDRCNRCVSQARFTRARTCVRA
jgi:hypothetical protein